MQLDFKRIGRKIRASRKRKGMTQEKVAKLVDVGVTHISHIETGNAIPSLKTFLAILNALDLSADELLGGSVNKSRYVVENEYARTLSGCEAEDVLVIMEVTRVLKETLQKQRAMFRVNSKE